MGTIFVSQAGVTVPTLTFGVIYCSFPAAVAERQSQCSSSHINPGPQRRGTGRTLIVVGSGH